MRPIRFVILSFLVVASVAAQDSGTSPTAFPFQGEVSGENVYVRSGAGVHWYPTTKLSQGTVVRVIGEQTGWLKIVPPPGSFSLVDASAIERAPGANKGTTKVDQVYVKVGSTLSDRKSAVQQILAKGVEVSILGETEGFLKIAPPDGSYLYISEQFVQPVGQRGTSTAGGELGRRIGPPPARPAQPTPDTSINTPATTETPDSTATTTDEPVSDSPTDATTPPSTTEPGGISGDARTEASINNAVQSAGKYRTMLEAAENELRNLLMSPDPSKGYTSLIDRYKPLAAQDEDRVAHAVAKVRIDQLTARAELEKIVADASAGQESVDAFRAKLGNELAQIRNTKLPPEQRAWDIKGELRISKAFNARPDRYRVIDPLTQRTVAYVDIPQATGIDSARFLNQYVGIRVSSQYFSTASKTNIAVASEIVNLPGPGMANPPAAVEARPTPPSDSSAPPPAASPRPIDTRPIQAAPSPPPPPARSGELIIEEANSP